MNKQKVSVIICCYNEGVRVLDVLNEIKRSKLVSEIIVVDDSSDEKSRRILDKVSGIKLVRNSERQGKSKAMEIGVLTSKSDIIAFVDADLFRFKKVCLDNLLRPILNDELDLVLGDREKELWIGRLFGLSIILTGERALSRDLLLKNMEIFSYGGYLAEVAMNRIFFKDKRVGKVLFKGVGQFMKHRKSGLFGLMADFRGLSKIAEFVGLKELINQMVFVKRIKGVNY
jgi:polyisoprenyl-phosphate glycosyltransferase